MAITSDRASVPIEQDDGLDPEEAVGLLLRDLRARTSCADDAACVGPLAAQLTHPLAVLLVIFLNAAFALALELQAERAVEALSRYLPQKATALRDGRPSFAGCE